MPMLHKAGGCNCCGCEYVEIYCPVFQQSQTDTSLWACLSFCSATLVFFRLATTNSWSPFTGHTYLLANTPDQDQQLFIYEYPRRVIANVNVYRYTDLFPTEEVGMRGGDGFSTHPMGITCDWENNVYRVVGDFGGWIDVTHPDFSPTTGDKLTMMATEVGGPGDFTVQVCYFVNEVPLINFVRLFDITILFQWELIAYIYTDPPTTRLSQKGLWSNFTLHMDSDGLCEFGESSGSSSSISISSFSESSASSATSVSSSSVSISSASSVSSSSVSSSSVSSSSSSSVSSLSSSSQSSSSQSSSSSASSSSASSSSQSSSSSSISEPSSASSISSSSSSSSSSSVSSTLTCTYVSPYCLEFQDFFTTADPRWTCFSGCNLVIDIGRGTIDPSGSSNSLTATMASHAGLSFPKRLIQEADIFRLNGTTTKTGISIGGGGTMRISADWVNNWYEVWAPNSSTTITGLGPAPSNGDKITIIATQLTAGIVEICYCVNGSSIYKVTPWFNTFGFNTESLVASSSSSSAAKGSWDAYKFHLDGNGSCQTIEESSSSTPSSLSSSSAVSSASSSSASSFSSSSSSVVCAFTCSWEWDETGEVWVFLQNLCALCNDPKYTCTGSPPGAGQFDGEIRECYCSQAANCLEVPQP